MKPAQAKAILKDIRERGYIEHRDVFYPPDQAKALGLDKPVKKKRAKYNRTGDIYDDLNIKHKAEIKDMFTMLMDKEKLSCWPEFSFTTERRYRLDYAFPEHKVGIEVNGGIWSKGNSGHSSGKGIQRDMCKNNLLQSLGWKTIAVTPDQLMTLETINLIRKMIEVQTSLSPDKSAS